MMSTLQTAMLLCAACCPGQAPGPDAATAQGLTEAALAAVRRLDGRSGRPELGSIYEYHVTTVNCEAREG